jgi:hypothetical protein
MPLFLLGGALKIIGGVGMTISGAIIVTKVLIDTGVIVP